MCRLSPIALRIDVTPPVDALVPNLPHDAPGEPPTQGCCRDLFGQPVLQQADRYDLVCRGAIEFNRRIAVRDRRPRGGPEQEDIIEVLKTLGQ